jgi:hypothetical protein
MHRFQKWRDALQVAPNTTSVNKVVVEYVATLAPFMDILPPECRKALLTKPVDIQAAALTCLQAELCFDGPDELRDALHEIAHTLAAASGRITSLHRGPLHPAG